ncbi:unnamed protein product [Chrysodeixis includens]|uniref:Peptidase S1 domain-containing protein n=1 Tax=Chrysodeixis includens TaxID=689277 RepID=A0A9P0BTJ4_CHRIL|nr:unnamed protein product [Chrysodeixis includens]
MRRERREKTISETAIVEELIPLNSKSRTDNIVAVRRHPTPVITSKLSLSENLIRIPIPSWSNNRGSLIILGTRLDRNLKLEHLEGLNLTVYDVSDRVVTMFGLDVENPRIKDLKEKLDKIGSYTVNNTLVADILSNVTAETNLTETNFYNALNENDHFKYLTTNDSKSLYLTLKEKMTRDDILKIVAERSQKKKLVKFARRMMEDPIAEVDDEEGINNVLDKMIGEAPRDSHKLKKNESIYWDPQNELEDLKQYHEEKRSGRRIFKGERTSIRYYPFMASLHIMGRFWCGAVLYWQDMAITSASCLQLTHNNRFFRENPRVVQLRMGSNHSRIGGEVIDVLEVFFHPGYNPKSLRNNLAVVRLRRRLHFSYHILPKIIAISHDGHSVPPTAEILVLGWGVTKISQRMPYEPIFLQRKFLPVYPNSFCKEVYGDKFISENMFCAGTLTTGEGACDHDAGGPAILSGRLVGIISFGPTICGFANAPTVFTLIGAFSDWIESVNESMPGYYRINARSTTTAKSLIADFLGTYKYSMQNAKVTRPPLLNPNTLHVVTQATTLVEESEGEETTTVKTTKTPAADEATEEPAPGRVAPQETGRVAYESDGGWSIEVKKKK